MTTMRESLISWVGDNYSFCRDSNNNICDKFPVDSRLTMIEATGMSAIPQWPEEEDLINPIYTEFGAPIKEDLSLGQLVKGRKSDIRIPRTKDTIGTFHSHPGGLPMLSPHDVMDALVHDDKVTCVGAGGITATKVKCYTRKEPQWSEWRERALQVVDDERAFDKAVSEVFRNPKTGKPLKSRKLHKVLEGLEPFYFRTTDEDAGETVKRLIQIGDRLTELTGYELGPRPGDIRKPGLITKMAGEEAPVLAEIDALRFKRGRLLEQIHEAKEGTDAEALQRTIDNDIDQRLIELQEEYAYLAEPVKQLIQEAESLREETGHLFEELDRIRADREKDQPDPRKYRQWRNDVTRASRDFQIQLEDVVSGTEHGYYIKHGYKYPSLIEDCEVYYEVFGKYDEDEDDEPKVPDWIERYQEFFKK